MTSSNILEIAASNGTTDSSVDVYEGTSAAPATENISTVGLPSDEHTPDLENSPPPPSSAFQEVELSRNGSGIDGSGMKDLANVDTGVLPSSTSPKSLTEIEMTATDSSEEQCSEEAPDSTENKDDGKNRDQSDQVKETAVASATAKSESPRKVPQPSLVLEHEIKEEVAITNDEVIDHQMQPIATHELTQTSKSGYSVPPHMRPDFPFSFARRAETLSSKMSPSNNVPRFHNNLRYNNIHHGSRSDIPSEQMVRLNAQLLKARQELEQERTKNANLHKIIQDAQHEHLEAAFSSMLATLLREQTEALALQSRAATHQRSLDMREKKISQQEAFLAAGQKHLMTKLDQETSTSMSAAHYTYLHQQMELDKQAHIAALKSRMAMERQTLTLHAAAQHKREQQYKTLVRQSLEAEIAANYMSNAEAESLAEARFQRGFDAGRDEGRKEQVKAEKEKAYLEGYRACFQAQAALSSLRKGASVEVQNLLDPMGEGNLFSMGIRVGRMEVASKVEVSRVASKEENVKKENVKEEEESSRYGITLSPTLSPPPSPVPVQKMTLAAELRGYTPLMHNGEVVLANYDAAVVGVASPEKHGRKVVRKNDGADLIDLL